MLFSDLRIPGKEGLIQLLIEKEKISAVSGLPHLPSRSESDSSSGLDLPGDTDPSSFGSIHLSLPGALVFPGLINSHDHLDFNLFPLLGNRIYSNYTDWGWDIHNKNAAKIKAVLKIPEELRVRWGIYKNLLNGFTTVVNHGDRLDTGKELISVLQDCYNLHSVGFERNWVWKLNRLRGDRPVVLHVGEGTDKAAHREIDRLIRWNFFKRSLIGVHGVAMDQRQAAHFKALVWCPDSNYFLLGKTAPISLLKEKTAILFGTDSTLTSGWNHWDQVRMARKEGAVTDNELMDMLTRTPARIWGLTDRGAIAAGQRADLVIARPKDRIGSPPSQHAEAHAGDIAKRAQCNMDAFYSLDPEDILLVMHKGQVRLFDGSLREALLAGGFDISGFSRFHLGGEEKFVDGDLPGLINEIRKYQPEAAIPESIH